MKDKIKAELNRRIDLLEHGTGDPEVMKRVEGVIKGYKYVLEYLDTIDEGIVKYVARDKDDRLFMYNLPPQERFEDDECFIPRSISEGHDDDGYIQLPKESFPEITWENSPVKIKIEL